MGPDNHYPNPWVRLLVRANKFEIEIDGKIGIALIDSGAMNSMMSREYCDKYMYEIQPLDRLVPIECSGDGCILFRLCRGQNVNSRDQLF